MQELTIYELTGAIRDLELAEDMTDEEKEKAMIIIEEELQRSSENIIKKIINWETYEEALKKEESRLKENRNIIQNKITRYKDLIKTVMEIRDWKKITTASGTITLAKNPTSVEVVDMSRIPTEFKRTKIIEEADKEKIKKHYQETGELIEGVSIIDNKKGIRIK